MNNRTRILPLGLALLAFSGLTAAEESRPSFHIDPTARSAPTARQEEPVTPGDRRPTAKVEPRRAVAYQTMEGAAKAGVNPLAEPSEAKGSVEDSAPAPLWKRYALPAVIGLTIGLVGGIWLYRRRGDNGS